MNDELKMEDGFSKEIYHIVDLLVYFCDYIRWILITTATSSLVKVPTLQQSNPFGRVKSSLLTMFTNPWFANFWLRMKRFYYCVKNFFKKLKKKRKCIKINLFLLQKLTVNPFVVIFTGFMYPIVLYCVDKVNMSCQYQMIQYIICRNINMVDWQWYHDNVIFILPLVINKIFHFCNVLA